jgi:AcrR family transcriptional regulator
VSQATRGDRTKLAILAAAQATLQREGFAKLSTRKIATNAEVPLSQIHYHFGSKEGLVLALLDHLDRQVFDRQRAMYDNSIPLSERWARACNFLDDDLASGYVRLLHECVAQGWSAPPVAERMCALLSRWADLLTEVAEEASARFGGLGPFSAAEITQLVAMVFIGAEAVLLLGIDEKRAPIKSALRKVGLLIAAMENTSGGES